MANRIDKIVIIAIVHLLLFLPTLQPSPYPVDISLSFEGSAVSCVGPTDHNYCLSWTFQAIKEFLCYLENELVYSCTSEGICTDHGRLVKNTRPSEDAEECLGIPFANIHPDAAGTYTCVAKWNDHQYNASYTLNFCKPPTVELSLEVQGKPATCITRSNHIDFCLSLKVDGKPAQGRVFRFYLNDNLVYNCDTDGNCEDHSVLKKNTRPPEAFEECVGLPFANIKPDLTGEYTVIIEDDIHLLEAKQSLHFCNDITQLKLTLNHNNEKVKCVDTQLPDLGNYCLAVGEKLDYIHDFECFFNEELIYTCDTPNSCTDKGIWSESHKVEGKHTIPRSISKECSGILFANLDQQKWGNYSCQVWTRNGNQVIGHYEIKTCSNDSETLNKISEKDPDISKKGILLVSLVVLLAVIIIGLLLYFAYKRWFCKSLEGNKSKTPESHPLQHPVNVEV